MEWEEEQEGEEGQKGGLGDLEDQAVFRNPQMQAWGRGKHPLPPWLLPHPSCAPGATSLPLFTCSRIGPGPHALTVCRPPLVECGWFLGVS